MHRIAATPGGWNPQADGVIFIDQTPAPIVLLTAADTDIQTLAQAIGFLPDDFPALRAVNLLQLQQQLTIDTYGETVLSQAQVIVVRLLGGRAYWPYGLEVVQGWAEKNGAKLLVLPGDDRPDPDLMSQSTVPLGVVNRLWQYFCEGGVDNARYALQYLAYQYFKPQNLEPQNFNHDDGPPQAQPVPKAGLYAKALTQPSTQPLTATHSRVPKVGILFYRSHYLAGNTAPIDALCEALTNRNLEPMPVFVSSLRELEVQARVLEFFQPGGELGVEFGVEFGVELILNTTGFAIDTLTNPGFITTDVAADVISDAGSGVAPIAPPPYSGEISGEQFSGKIKDETLEETDSFWQRLNCPVLQVILSGGTEAQWQDGYQGLSPKDMAMNVVLPEVDGRIITRAVSFKAVEVYNPDLQVDVVRYEPLRDRINFVADLAANWLALAQTPPSQRRIALILANYPNRDGRLANGVGLDTPESCVQILKALQQAGYWVENIPTTGQELIDHLTTSITNDPEGWSLRPVHQFLDLASYCQYFATLPPTVQRGILDRWGKPHPRPSEQLFPPTTAHYANSDSFPIPGLQLGHIFVGIQPSRGYDQDPSLNYHAPDLEPTHDYLGFYDWLRQKFQAQAIVHVGKHGNLEWLPGKGVALSAACYPEVACGALPHFYPFIVNDPGEGSQAKRRTQAVILDHLTPPMTRAELYGALLQLEQGVDEYYEAQSLDPGRLPVIRQRILELVQQEHLDQELALGSALQEMAQTNPMDALMAPTNPELPGLTQILDSLDSYLCELKEAQVRDGLHIFGQCPSGRQLRDLIVAIARSPSPGRIGLTRALAQDFGLDFDPLTADLGQPYQPSSSPLSAELGQCRTLGDVVEQLEHQASQLVEQLLDSANPPAGPRTQRELDWIVTILWPGLQRTDRELTHLLQGLNGDYVPPGPSGAPTRGRPEVLPTGRNFYSVDLRGLPTESAWALGRKAAEVLIERYCQEQGDYPRTIGLSVWGTSTMRTGGDDVAEALALLGVKPVWDGPSRRVVDFEVLPLGVLGRPRVDVTLRISGFFRDAFPNLIDLFDQAVQAVAALLEPPDQNPLAAQVQTEANHWQALGLTPDQAQDRATYRIFGSKPGAYGAGLQGLIEAQNWDSDGDLAQAYINWSSYAYRRSHQGNGNDLRGFSAPEAFQQRLAQMQVVLHNQDNREHDLLDSDDYYQFQGGLTAAVRKVAGQQPQVYFGDHSRPENPRIRRLSEEIARVYRSRVINPKWIAGAMRHGYKGAFEMAATVDYLFAYDATAHCVADHMYEGVAQAYVLDPQVQAFVQCHNPWALRDMAERLLEANQRGLWQGAGSGVLEELRMMVLAAEGTIETTTSPYP
jgi:cobaltochelatase CobN